MRIYIDEAGGFVPPTVQGSSYSVVLALVVPSTSEKQLLYEFLRLRDSWPEQRVEIKGSSLDEKQASQLIGLLSAYDVVVDFVSLDMALHTDIHVDSFKSRQAAAVTAHISREYSADIVHHMALLERAVRNMPNQLFIQAELTIDLILGIVQTAALYYVQRIPAELGDIAWIVDRKSHTLTEMEETWSTLILPSSESHFMKKPFKMLKGADYSHFERYEVDLQFDEGMARHLTWLREVHGRSKPDLSKKVTNSKRLLTEQLSFLDSRESLGLQLADMLASILRRALNNHLQKSGWKDFGRLVVYDPRPGWFSRLGPEIENPVWPHTAIDVWHTLRASAKRMVPG